MNLYHRERNHQGKGNVLLFPPPRAVGEDDSPIQSRPHDYFDHTGSGEEVQCRRSPGPVLQDAVWFKNACASIAWGQGGAWGASWGQTQAAASANGVAACVAHGGQGCAEWRTICSLAQ